MRSCNSSVTESIRRTVLLNAKSPLVLANDNNRLRASTISLTRFMSLSNNSTLTLIGAATSVERSGPGPSLASGISGSSTRDVGCSTTELVKTSFTSCGVTSINEFGSGVTGTGAATLVLALPDLGKSLPPSVKNLSHSINSESSPTDSVRCF